MQDIKKLNIFIINVSNLFIYLFNLHCQTWFYVSELQIDKLNQLFHHTVLPVDAPPNDSSNPYPSGLVVDPGSRPSPEYQSSLPVPHGYLPSFELTPRALFQVFLGLLHDSNAKSA